MSFLDRIKGAGRNKPEADIPLPSSPFDDMSPPQNPNEATVRLGQSTLSPGSREGADSSIITEAAPSELAQEFSETRLPGADIDSDGVGFNSGLPAIGAWPLARQQRALVILFAVGLIGLLLAALLVLTSSSRGATQVGDRKSVV